ncbi:MAG TPA: FAD-linked oxidase C-terminal domain-containing protein [Thermomicrobiales bacterium]|nr:FAD-linked oxidase C-terminal domain-containing protein [Thermomicrobiales bacterium]
MEPPQAPPPGVDVAALAADLQGAVRGEVRFDGGTKALYASDLSIYRQIPIGVVIPKDVDDAVAAVAACRRHGAPLLPRGCGSSLAGQTCNVAVVLDFSKYMHRVLEIDTATKLARVEPGCINDVLNAAAERHGLRFPPDPATHAWATLGGGIGNNSCGTHSIMHPPGRTSDHTEELDILLYDGTRLTVGHHDEEELARIVAAGGRRGEIYGQLRDLRDRYADRIRAEFPPIERLVSGFNLQALLPEHGFDVAKSLVGTEGTCVTVLGATMRLVDDPGHRVTLVLGYPDVFHAADHIAEIRVFHPTGLEAIGARIPENLRHKGQQLDAIALLPDGGGWLFVEFRGERVDDSRAQAERLQAQLRRDDSPPRMKLLTDEGEQARVWEVREHAIGASRISGELDTWAAWEDAAVPVDRLGAYLREFRDLLDRHHLRYVLFGHFGQACVHCRTDNDLKTAEGIRDFRAFMEESADLTVKYGGSLSGEHGDGQLRGELLGRMYSPELIRAFDEFKAIWDPDNQMNPRKTVSDTYKLDENLRLGAGYNPPAVKTHFSFIDDHGSFAAATERCYGFGLCRRLGGGTMCPSFMATREEAYTTRGRTRLLFEMLQGEAITDGWRSEAVKDALDLCLACKGCKGDCPVAVDVATYKAEFLSHYYAGRLRPPAAYAFGLVMWWARLAAAAPGLVNLLSHAPGVSTAGKRLLGIAPSREIPRFAGRTFHAWFAARGPRNPDGERVVLWPDTFTNYFEPEVGRAAVEVLEAQGYRVALPPRPLCCGRPLYDYGMLTLAERFLRQILDALRDDIAAGVPVVGLEPSCVSVFRDELRNLFPHDQDALRLGRQTFLLSEFLLREDYRPPQLRRKALVHAHCHHKAILGLDAERELLDRLDLDYEIPEDGCCGMAGGFGYEADKCEVSLKVGERALLPAVRAAAKDTLIIADGYSCRSQIAQETNRRALHLAQVLQLALRDGDRPPADYPESRYCEAKPAHPDGRGALLVGAGAALAGGALAAWRHAERRASDG